MALASWLRGKLSDARKKVSDAWQWVGDSLPLSKKEEETPKKWPKTRLVADYLWGISQVGMARGHALGTAFQKVFNLPGRSYGLNVFFGLHIGASFFRKFGKNSKHTSLRLLAWASKAFQNRTALIPLLVTIGTAFGVTNPIAITAIFTLSVWLSVIKPSLEKKFSKKEERERLRQTPGLTYDHFMEKLNDHIIPLLKRAGQGALTKEAIVIFIEALADGGWISSAAASTSPWLFLFMIVPAIMESIITIAKKMDLSEEQRKVIDKMEETSHAVGDAMESFGYTTILTEETNALFNPTNQVTDQEYFSAMGAGAAFGTIAGIKSAYDTRRKREKQRQKQAAALDAALGDVPHLFVEPVPPASSMQPQPAAIAGATQQSPIAAVEPMEPAPVPVTVAAEPTPGGSTSTCGRIFSALHFWRRCPSKPIDAEMGMSSTTVPPAEEPATATSPVSIPALADHGFFERCRRGHRRTLSDSAIDLELPLLPPSMDRREVQPKTVSVSA